MKCSLVCHHSVADSGNYHCCCCWCLLPAVHLFSVFFSLRFFAEWKMKMNTESIRKCDEAQSITIYVSPTAQRFTWKWNECVYTAVSRRGNIAMWNAGRARSDKRMNTDLAQLVLLHGGHITITHWPLSNKNWLEFHFIVGVRPLPVGLRQRLNEIKQLHIIIIYMEMNIKIWNYGARAVFR